MKECKFCKYVYLLRMTMDGKDVGCLECRRFPPKNHVSFVRVYGNYWCGEHKRMGRKRRLEMEKIIKESQENK